MTEFSVSGTATRLVRETFTFSATVRAANLAGVEAATRNALAAGNFDYEDEEKITPVDGAATLTELSQIENCGEYVPPAPAPAWTPTTGYAPAARPAAPQGGFAVADVQPRANGYVPVRVAHRAAR